MVDFIQIDCFFQCICICVPNCLHWQFFFLPFISVVHAQLSEAGEHVSFIEATPLSTPEVFPESSLSDLPFGSRCPLFRHTFLFMVPLPIQLLRARGASSTSFARELCTGVFDHNPFETSRGYATSEISAASQHLMYALQRTLTCPPTPPHPPTPGSAEC